MKYLIYPLIIYLLLFEQFSLVMADDKIDHDLLHFQKIDLPFTSKQAAKYYYWKDDILFMSPDDKLPYRFSAEEYAYKPKITRFDWKPSFYFPAIYFIYKKIIYKGIIYIEYGDNDTPIFIFQLNSYDVKGNFIDAIKLDERLSAEGEALWWSDFKIEANGNITVNQMEQTLVDDNERYKNGDIHFLKKSRYKMSDKGIFTKIEETIIDKMYTDN